VPRRAFAATAGLFVLLLIPTFASFLLVRQVVGTATMTAHPWIAAYAGHAGQAAGSIAVILWLTRGQPARFGLSWPAGRSYLGAAVGWGVFFGLVMLVVDHLPALLARRPPGEATAPADMVAWLGFEWIFVGPTEELPFRGVLLGFLSSRSRGTVTLFGVTVSSAGFVIAALFALAHVNNFWHRAFLPALGQQLYAFALAILYTYLLERSGSLVAPSVSHDVSDGVEYALVYVLDAVFSPR
jgi:membrane protease YdiL (CAAX protease family)